VIGLEAHHTIIARGDADRGIESDEVGGDYC
jgi:hypothetical protein